MIIDRADVVMKMAENNCESIVPLIPMEPINSVTIRNIINDLIKAENWKIALELSVKWDRSGTSGVFSAWGVSAIKAGRYRFAREKITLALQSVNGSSTQINNLFIKMFINLLNDNNAVDPTWFNYRQSTRSPPLLQEVLESLETNASRQPKSEVPSNVTVESPTNVLNLLSNLKNISEGDYGPATKKPLGKFEWQSNSSPILSSHYYEESVYYLTNYGGNAEYISFLMVSNLISSTLRYVIAQQIPTELFIHRVFVPIAKTGRLSEFIDLVKQMDGSFKIWEDYIIAACKYLERKRALHCLYQMQILIGDFVRAALTCIKFYLDGSEITRNFIQDVVTWLIYLTGTRKTIRRVKVKKEIALKWDLKKINAHINIISLQIEVSKYLARCEADGLPTIGLMPRIFLDKPGMKTLFGLIQERNHVAILLLLCGHSIENGFGLSYRVIQECSLSATKIYSTCIKYLAKNVSRLLDVEKFIESIKTNAANEENVIDIETLDLCDELVAMAVEIAYNQHQANAKNQIDKLIKLITSI
ncbi:CLUMA_CG015441, isoform A [Clunio marinus]|uniref:CLUMA_CG015441, isoform A n=1 Tax=Clunio marinus TaxID=568069 RepID=A0A1J1ISC5_9DIPT|nr:CLUMA_CG015441, isoform A [Clunio marinus]